MEDELKKIYYSPQNPASFQSVDKIYSTLKINHPQVKKQFIKNWLNKQLVYSLHKDARKNFIRNPVIAQKKLENYQADLIDMTQYSRSNGGFKFILTVIDVFSKVAFAIPIKNKSAQTVCQAFQSVLKDGVPLKLQTDKGKEFENRIFKKLMDENDINHFTARNPRIKCSIIERFNKTLKNKLFKLFTHKGDTIYINQLENLMKSYNSTYHNSIKMKPIEVSHSNSEQVFKNLYGYESRREMLRKTVKSVLEKGDKVRIVYDKKLMDRGYYPNWTDEIFTINRGIGGVRKPQYTLEGKDRKFYPEEIQKTGIDIFRIEKIIKQKIVNKEVIYFVKWLNHPASENSWIKASDILQR